jgi:hypothetical protein
MKAGAFVYYTLQKKMSIMKVKHRDFICDMLFVHNYKTHEQSLVPYIIINTHKFLQNQY